MRILLPILFQVFYFVSLGLVVKKRRIIKKSPYFVLICGVLVLGVLANSITIYEIYEYFSEGREIEFFLGGFILNYTALRMAQKNAEK